MADQKKMSNSGGNYKEEAYKIMMRSPRGLGLSPAEKKKAFRSVDMSPAEMAEILPQSTSESKLSLLFVVYFFHAKKTKIELNENDDWFCCECE